MNITLKSPDLKRLVKKLASVQSETTILDPLKGVLHAFDSDITVVVTSPLLVATEQDELSSLEGAVAFSSKQFASLCGKTTGEVSITISSNRVVVKSKRAVFEIPTTHSKFPVPGVPASKYTLQLKDVANALVFASSASVSKERNNYTGAVQMRVLNKTLRAVATDHRRLALAEVPVTTEDFTILCPVVVAQALKSLEGEELTIGETPTQLFFSASEVVIIGRKLVKPFPKYEQLIPTQPGLVVNLQAEVVKESLDVVSPILLEDDKGVRRLRMRFANNLFKLFVNNGAALAEDTTDCEMVLPEPIWGDDVGFECTVDHRAMIDFFSVVKGNITATGTKTNAPILFAADNYKMLVTTMT